jgi:glutamate:GABA antiporter
MAAPAVPADALVDRTTKAALEEKAKLQKHFGRFDIFFFLICTLVGLDTLGAVSNDGAQAFTWLAFLGIFFFVPYALLAAELGSSFPAEGGAYIWVKLAFGRFTASINSVLYWLSNPIWLGGTLTILAVTTFGDFFTPLTGVWKYLFSIAFIWFAVWAAILSFGVGKRIPTIGAWVRSGVLGLFTLTVILYAAQNGVHGVGASEFKPTWGIFIAAVPVLFFNYVGFELPNAAGDEMKDPQKDVPFTVLRAAIGTFVLYGAPILAILLVLPAAQITSLGGFIDAIKDRVHRLRRRRRDRQGRHRDRDPHRRRQGARRHRGARLHLGAAVERDHLDHGRRPSAGRGRLRRRRAALVRRLLPALGRADRGQRPVRRLLDDRDAARLRPHQR